MALTTVTVHGEVLAPDGLTPAVGYVRFRTLHELRDTVANIVYAPDEWTATLDVNGEFTIVLPATDNPDITPLNWSYQVWIQTDVWREGFFIQLPFSVGVVEFADLIEISTGTGSDCTPDGTACAPISIIATIAALQAELDALELVVAGTLASIAAIQAAILVLQADTAANAAAIATLQGQVTTLQGQMATAQAQIIVIQGQITTIQGQIVVIQGQITTLQTDVAANTAAIVILQGQMLTAQGQITTLQGQVATLQGEMLTAQGQITTLQGQVAALQAADIALDLAKVNRSGDTMTGDLIISNAYLRQSRTVAAGAAIPAPAITINFTTVPLTTDPNIFQVSINGAVGDLAAWLNEVGHYRAEQRTNFLFDHLVTLIASNAVGTGRLIRFERRDGANVRQITGGVDQDGRLETSLYPFVTAGFVIDPGATGKYTILVAANVATIGVRRETNDLARLQGRIAVSVVGFISGDVIMTVPAAFIPAQNRWLNTTTSGGISVPCEVLSGSGNVVCRRTQAGAANISYDDVVYKTSLT